MKSHPIKTAKLFIEGTDFNSTAYFDNPIDKFYLYSEGYKYSGLMLLNKCLEASYNNNFLIYPMIFNFRHFVELRLKELIMMSYNILNNSKFNFPNNHDLKTLWDIYRNKLLPLLNYPIEKEILDKNESLIMEFHVEDPISMAYRFPISKAPDRKYLINRISIDLENFKIKMQDLINFLETQTDLLGSFEDNQQGMINDIFRGSW